METISLRRWPKYLEEWARTSRSIRDPVEIFGRITNSANEITIGMARDPFGTVLFLNPGDLLRPDSQLRQPPTAVPGTVDQRPDSEQRKETAKRHKEEGEQRKWRQTWAKIAVRAGYLAPAVDPIALRAILAHRRESRRVELILDTNALIGGLGHWLLRLLGDRADLVRTAVTDLEIQRFGQMLRDAKSYEYRFNFNAACRFLERIPHAHPVWRHLDTEEETALFVAKAHDQEKSPGADTLMLRAVRRSIQEMVPGLRRFFVTSDQTLGRAASHELPANSTVVGYINPISANGVHLAPLTWWPARDQGLGVVTGLADFVWEALCLCDDITLRRRSGASLRLSAYQPGSNMYPSSWARPLLWIERNDEVAPQSRGESGRSSHPVVAPATEWLLEEHPLPSSPVEGVCETAKGKILESLYSAYRALASSDTVPFDGMQRDVVRLLIAIRVVDDDGRRGERAEVLERSFQSHSPDLLSHLLTYFAPYCALIAALRTHGSLTMEDANKLLKRSVSPMTGIARHLGQVVKDESLLRYGGAVLATADFLSWLRERVAALSSASPMKEASIVALARDALMELHMSPLRFERALHAALRERTSDFVPSAGGTPQRVLQETIVKLSSSGVQYSELSADGLLGYRTLRHKGGL